MSAKVWGSTKVIGVALAIIAAAALLGVGAFVEQLWRTFTGPPFGSDGPQSSWCATWAGDVDDDGTPDVLLATPFEGLGAGRYGSVRVISGASRACLRAIADVWNPNPSWLEIGPAGDVDGDADVFMQQYERYVVIDVRSGAALQTFDTGLSEIFTSIGDVDFDGCDDLLVGGYPRAVDPVAFVSAISGKTGKTVWCVEGRDGKKGNVPRPFA